MRKHVLHSGREDVRALDLLFKATRLLGVAAMARILRFFCDSQGITAAMIWKP